ncbi:hypothetical protein ARSQ2_00503 [Arsenophonus endosymbiont of Bemisia tabaci Q2]|nr:hypothetical protein ARSQ2_00503 [Arsenophonus endosymbiont of Bemisia tabaci Q2]
MLAFLNFSPAVNIDLDFWAAPRLLLATATGGILVDFFPGTEICFSFFGLLCLTMNLSNDSTLMHWVSSFRHRQLVRFISAYQLISLSAYQLISLSAYQLISLSAAY